MLSMLIGFTIDDLLLMLIGKLQRWRMKRDLFRLLAYEGVEVINPEGGKENAEEEAQRGRWKDEERDSGR
ncbi:unnamed protein product [Eruca vesicaria subsp. sativa]|uniref:Uncharacterized protein n=1 Tax=Eruca vesicaria subsp. sativa TaxID=29727 RepID=A0ABC8LF93_ERUVS|nr:unnamed protein product [Eruca vesicaria subsp. sativa]